MTNIPKMNFKTVIVSSIIGSHAMTKHLLSFVFLFFQKYDYDDLNTNVSRIECVYINFVI